MYTDLGLLVSHMLLSPQRRQKDCLWLHHPGGYSPAGSSLSCSILLLVCLLLPEGSMITVEKKCLGWFVPLGDRALTAAASSASLKFRSEHPISDVSVPYTAKVALAKCNLENFFCSIHSISRSSIYLGIKSHSEEIVFPLWNGNWSMGGLILCVKHKKEVHDPWVSCVLVQSC